MAINKQECNLQLTSQINEITRIMRSQIQETAIENFEGDKKALQAYVQDAIEDTKKQIEEAFSEGNRGTIDALTVEKLKGSLKRQTIDILNTYKAINENIAYYDSLIKRSKELSGKKGAIKTFFQRTHNLTRGEGRFFDEMIDTTIDALETGGVRSNPEVNANVRRLFQEEISGSDSINTFLRDKYNIDNPDMEFYLAIKAGSSKIPELDVLARALKKIDESTSTRVQKNAPYFNVLKDHVLPVRVDRAKLNQQGFAEFDSFIREHADLDALTNGNADNAQALAFTIKHMFENMATDRSFDPISQFQKTTNLFGHRKIHFTSDKAEFDFISKFGDMHRGVLGGYLSHRRNLLKKTVLYNLHGPDISFNMFNLHKKLIKEGIEENEAYRLVQDNANDLKLSGGLKTHVEEMSDNILQGASNLVSAGLTGGSTLRNLAYDNTIHTALVSSFLKKNSTIMELGRTIWGLTKTMAKGKQTDELARLFERQGITTRIAQHTLYQGHVDNALATTAKGGNKYAKAFSQYSYKAAGVVSKYGGADLTFKSSRVSQASNAGGMILDSINKPWGELTEGLRVSFEQAGLSKADLGVLRKVKRLTFEGKDLSLDANKFDKIPEESIQKILRPLETVSDARRRLKYGYQTLMNDLTDELSSITSKRGQLVPIKSLDHPMTKGIMQGVFKFSNIAFSQWFNFMRALHKANGLDPNLAGGLNWSYAHLFKKNPVLFGKMLSMVVGGGLSAIWLNDLSNLKTPRDISPETLYLALTYGGAGGLVSMMYNSIMFSDDIISTPYNAFIKPGKQVASGVAKGDLEKTARGAIRLGKKTIPGVDLWYTRAAINLGIRKGIGLEYTSNEQRGMRERGQKPLIK